MPVSMCRRLGPLVSVAGVLSLLATASAQKTEAAPMLLAVAAYLATYERDVVAVVAQEDYRQRVADRILTTRHYAPTWS